MGNGPLSVNYQIETITPDRTAFFSWDLASDRLYGDDLLADLFDLDRQTVTDGVPIRAIIDSIVEDDRPRIAAAIHNAILSGDPYQETYRVSHHDGSIIQVTALGRCFRSGDGVPSFYVGAVLESNSHVHDCKNPLEMHCRTALSLAQDQGSELVTRYLSSALRAMQDGKGKA